jgi:hypothetical protein
MCVSPGPDGGRLHHLERYRHAFGRLQIDWPRAGGSRRNPEGGRAGRQDYGT